jgi:hypothetical protein
VAGYRPAHARQASGEVCATEVREDAGRRETGCGDDRNGAERGGGTGRTIGRRR